jgi:hypothetical protein
MTRQQAYQMRHHQAGLCRLCSKEAVTASHCLEHAVQVREWQRRRTGNVRRNRRSKTYRLERKRNEKIKTSRNQDRRKK